MDAQQVCPTCGDPAVEVGRIRKSGASRETEQPVLACNRCQTTWEAEPGRPS